MKKNKKHKNDTTATELLFGAHPIMEALKAGKRKIISIYTTKPLPKAWKRIEPFLPPKHLKINYVHRESLTRMCNTTEHMGVAAWMTTFPLKKTLFDSQNFPKILLLDSVQDVRNVGAIIRSAHCTGFDGVVLCKGSCAPLGPTTIKASAGLAEHMPIFLAPSMSWAAQELKKNGYNLYMSVLKNGKDLGDVEIKTPACLVIGNEASGISPQIQKYGTSVTLQQKSDGISYNASVAAGILMFLISYQK